MSWIEDIQGLTTVLDENDAPVQRRSVIKFEGATVADDGTKTVVSVVGGGGAGTQSITGDATPTTVAELKQTVDSLVAALVALGLATDNRA